MESSAFVTPASQARPVALRRRPGLPLPRVLLCDLDGTLVDTMPVMADLAARVIAETHGTPRFLARELYLTTCGLPFFQQLEVIWPDDPRNDTAAARFEAKKPGLCRSARMSTDTRRALITLQGRGSRIVVSSNNGAENVAAFARDCGFDFDLVLGFGDGLAKGAPHIARAEGTFGVGRKDVVFVGDSLHDGDMAANLGVPFVGVAGTFSKERFALRFPAVPVVRRFADLIDLFD